MAWSRVRDSIPGMTAGVDLSAAQYFLVKLDAQGRAVPSAASTDNHVGVVQDAQALVDGSCFVGTEGQSKVVAGAALTPGQYVTSDASGKAVAAASGEPSMGMVLFGAAALDDVAVIDLERRTAP